MIDKDEPSGVRRSSTAGIGQRRGG